MKYWGPIRIAELKNRTDAELHIGHLACQDAARMGFLKILGGFVAGILAAVLTAVPLLPALLICAAPVLMYLGYKDARRNIDGMRAHDNESARRVLLLMSPPQPAPALTPAPAAAPAPIFNSEAAVTLDADITTMKTIRLSAKAAPAAQ